MHGSKLALQNLSDPLSWALPTSVNVKGKAGKAGLINYGWWGIDVQPEKYTGSFFVKGSYRGHFEASLHSAESGEMFAKSRIESRCVSHDWVQHHFTLEPKKAASNVNNTFSITFNAEVCYPLLCWNAGD